jgi:hypothetical protein
MLWAMGQLDSNVQSPTGRLGRSGGGLGAFSDGFERGGGGGGGGGELGNGARVAHFALGVAVHVAFESKL